MLKIHNKKIACIFISAVTVTLVPKAAKAAVGDCTFEAEENLRSLRTRQFRTTQPLHDGSQLAINQSTGPVIHLTSGGPGASARLHLGDTLIYYSQPVSSCITHITGMKRPAGTFDLPRFYAIHSRGVVVALSINEQELKSGTRDEVNISFDSEVLVACECVTSASYILMGLRRMTFVAPSDSERAIGEVQAK